MGTESAPRFDEHLNRITTREQAIDHLEEVLHLGNSYNPSAFKAEVYEHPEEITDAFIFFRSDDKNFSTTEDPYKIFLDRYNLANGTIPAYKFKLDTWNTFPCIRIRITE